MQLAPSGQERLLRDIVRRGQVAAHQAAQLRTHSTLVAANEFPEGLLIIAKSASDERMIDARLSRDFIHANRRD